MALTEREQEREILLGSLLTFIKTYYLLRNNREFALSDPIGRESHYITVCRELTKLLRLETKNLLINLPPGSGKSTMMVYFISWAFAHYPDCQFLYVSHAKHLAEKHTSEIKAIMSMPHYYNTFGVHLSDDTTAKGYFKTTAGGQVVAMGSTTVVGVNSGLPNLDRFSGLAVMDDMHNPDEVHSDVERQSVKDNYNQTIKPRRRGNNVGMLYVGHRLHEDDLPSFLIEGKDGLKWEKVILKAIDDAGNALAPNLMSLEALRIEQELNNYTFASQYQQDPVGAGSGIFKPEWFVVREETPKNIIATFLCCDTAETDKTWNDASVFSFFGIYKIDYKGIQLDNVYGLHWIDCIELRVEPKDLESEFMQFWSSCMRFPVKPKFAAIERKSTGTFLCSILGQIQGLRIIDIERTSKSGSKTTRFLKAQPFVANKQISLLKDAKHTKMCIDHMSRITPNGTHRHDDVADTLVDGIKFAFIDKMLINSAVNPTDYEPIAKELSTASDKRYNLRKQMFGK